MPTIRSLALAASGLGLLAAPVSNAFTLQILHASDLEGGLDALNRAANFGAIVENLESMEPNTIILSAGDNYIPGPFFNAAADRATFRDSGLFNDVYNALYGLPDPGGVNETYGGLREEGGRVDISIMNIIGFDASAVGNHEFDSGSDAFEQIIEEDFRGVPLADDRWVGAQFPYLSANLDFTSDADLGNLYTSSILFNGDFATGPAASVSGLGSTPKLAPATLIDVNGETVGVVGATTQVIETISSPGDTVETTGGDNDMSALAAVLQPVIDDIKALGVNKIVLVSHLQQLAFEEELATLLSGVDVIIAGGSDTLLADATDVLNPGDSADGSYPVLTSDADLNPVAIVSTDGEYSYVGRLVVEFDGAGNIIPSSIDPNVSGPVGTEVAGFDYGALKATTTSDDLIQALVDAVQSVIIAKDGNIAGNSKVFVEGRREQIRTQETNMGNLTADANLAIAQAYDPAVEVSLKNGGGIRAPFGEIDSEGNLLPTQANPLSGKEDGEISQLDIENSLRFNNLLSLVDLNAEQLKEVLEHGVAATGPGSTPGQFPQVAGVRFSFDEALPAGSRVQSIALIDLAGNTTEQLLQDGVWVGDAGRPVRMVTLNFLAGGGDGYPFPAFDPVPVDLTSLPDPGGVFDFAAAGSEQDALAEYLAANFPADAPFCEAETPIQQDSRIQQLAFRSDSVNFPPVVPEGAKQLTKIGDFQTGIFDEGASEIAAFDSESQRIFATNADSASVTILDASDPTAPVQVGEINIADLFGGSYGDVEIEASPNSVDVSCGVVAVAVELTRIEADGDDETATPKRGLVGFFDTDGNFITKTKAGYLPDMLTFDKWGRKLVVANEGEPNDDYTIDPEGSVSIVNTHLLTFASKIGVPSRWLKWYKPRTKTAHFWGFDADELRAEGVRIFGPDATAAQDLEPEYVCLSECGRMAFVSCQENNAIAVVDTNRARVLDIVPLGAIDYGAGESKLDPSDRDDTINIESWPVHGLFLPDSIACYTIGGCTYIVGANEGDARDYDGFSEEERLKDLDLDPTAFPDDSIQDDEALGRLSVTTVDSDPDGDGDVDKVVAFGTRSFTIWKVVPVKKGRRIKGYELERVFDSADAFEQITATLIPADFNANNDENQSFESRSDNKGPEPEGVTVGEVDGRICAFVGLERVGGVMVYDVTDPAAPQFVQYVTARDFAVEFDGDDPAPEDLAAVGDLGPEGLEFVPAEDSPTGSPLLIVANEVSGNISIFEIGER